MSDKTRPPFLQLVRSAVEALGGKTTNVAVRDWILERHPDANTSTIQANIIFCTVNHASRINFSQNQKPREANGRHDFLFRPERGKIELYDPEMHGLWKIAKREDGKCVVMEAGEEPVQKPPTDREGGGGFVAEDHLRDYLVQHLDMIEPGLQLFVDDEGNDGVEYRTPVGRIDILAVDKEGGFVVVELKVGRGPDSVCGQIMRYRSWVKRHLADGKRVRGFIIAQHISDRIRYGVADLEDIYLKEYELNLLVRDVPGLDDTDAR